MTFKPFLTSEEIASLQEQEAQSSKERKRTPEQIEAIYSNGNNILVSASAGSGKTFVIVERIMDKILRGVTVDQLFISTFTVKAAGELRERLEKQIHDKLTVAKDTELKSYLNEQLVGLQTADIGTMDAFTQKLVNQYGYTLGISPTFRIMTDKSEQDILKNDVFADLFSDYMTGKQKDVFRQLVHNFSGKDSTAFKNMVYTIYDFSQSTSNPKVWLSDTFLKGAEAFTTFKAIPDQVILDVLTCMQDTADQLQDVTNLEYYKQTTKTGKPTANYQNHLNIIEQLREKALHFESQYGRDGLGCLASDVMDLIPASPAVTVAGEKYPVFKNLQKHLKNLKHLEIIFKYQPESLPLLKVLQAFMQDFSEQYLQAKIQENAFEFSDIAHFAIQILEENDDIRQLYQDKYHEVMVDEYQDNNHMQERLLDLLSNGHNRFMVGDIKQSIYRFRQADPQIFNQTFKDFQANPEHGSLILLKENFRSQSEVLDATNSVFSHLMDEAVGEIFYDDTHKLVAGSPAQKESHPENETQVLIYDTGDNESTTDSEADDITPNEVKLVAKEIIRLHNEEKVPFNAITLLVSSRTRNTAILQTFDKYGLPLVSDGGETNYLKSVEVMVMLDTLRALDNPLNDYALVALIRSPMFAFDEDDLARLALQNQTDTSKENLYQKLEHALAGQGEHAALVTPTLRDKLTDFMTCFAQWRTFAQWHSLYELIWKIYNERFYYDYVGNLPRGEQRQANLYALALRANHFEKTGFKGLSRFIRMIDRILSSQNDLADVEVALPKNAVNLMTIHKSKGLEFEYVFILNSDKTFSNQDVKTPYILSRANGIGIKYVADIKDELENLPFPAARVSMDTLPYQINKRELQLAKLSEQMRLLYVAMTRAQKRLYLVGKGKRETLADKYSGRSEKGHLPVSEREQFNSFQDWLLAIHEAYAKKDLAFTVTYVTDEDLTEDKIGRLAVNPAITPDDLTDNRQSNTISEALDRLEAVEHLNDKYHAAIHLPNLRTPSQVKKLYEPMMDTDGVDVMTKPFQSKPIFALPDFAKKPKVEATAIGSALHELMQRISLSHQVTLSDITAALAQVSASDEVKKKIRLENVLAFFENSELGQWIQTYHDKVYREAPFAMLKQDPESQENFVVRGIVDGYLLLEDRIVLFDYKTDKYTNSEEIKNRYQGQMALYAEALSKSYQNKPVDKYLILLGGERLQVLSL